jgi:CHAD domain-containing protein
MTFTEFQDWISKNIVNYNKFRLFFNPQYFPILAQTAQKDARREFMEYFKLPEQAEIMKTLEVPDKLKSELMIAKPEAIITKYRAIMKKLNRERTMIEGKVDELAEILKNNSYDKSVNYEDLQKRRALLKQNIADYTSFAQRYNDWGDKFNRLLQAREEHERRIRARKETFYEGQKREYDRLITQSGDLADSLNRLRDEYAKLKSMKAGTHNCPYCNAELQGEKLKGALAVIDEDIRKNIATGNARKMELDKVNARIKLFDDNNPDDLFVKDPDIIQMMADKEELDKTFKEVKAQEPEKPEHIGEIQEELNQITNLMASFDQMKINSENKTRHEARMDEIGDSIEECEIMIRSAESFDHAQAKYIVDKVNENFKHVKIEMFKILRNGDKREVFDITFNGVQYPDCSGAEKVIIGLEIQQFFKKHCKNKIPVIIDEFARYPDIDIEEYISPGEQVIKVIPIRHAKLQIKEVTNG